MRKGDRVSKWERERGNGEGEEEREREKKEGKREVAKWQPAISDSSDKISDMR